MQKVNGYRFPMNFKVVLDEYMRGGICLSICSEQTPEETLEISTGAYTPYYDNEKELLPGPREIFIEEHWWAPVFISELLKLGIFKDTGRRIKTSDMHTEDEGNDLQVWELLPDVEWGDLKVKE